MPQRDIYHDAVRDALINDGWSITHDPYRIVAGTQDVYVDLGAERLIAAERVGEAGTVRIAVEVKSFVGRSSVTNLEQAIGQYLLYKSLLARQEPERVIYLAIPQQAYESVFTSVMGQVALTDYPLKLIVCDIANKKVTQWRF